MKKIANITWQSPSNIAFVKYWGKRGNQYPMNPSLSMTLDKCYTTTTIEVVEKQQKNDDIDLIFKFQGKENKQFTDRIHKYFCSIQDRLPALRKYQFQIESSNSFPHSAGIASSASAMSALALCLSSFERQKSNDISPDFWHQAAILARLGSGSATRSLYSDFSIWGEVKGIVETSDEYGISLPFTVDKVYSKLKDTILIIDGSAKKVSSSAGHALMNNHPFAKQRFTNARLNLNRLVEALKSGDFDEFTEIIESEALSLHAMMLTAKPWYSLLAPNTLVVLDRIRLFREETQTKIAFTLDAGPNVHIIYPEEEQEKVKEFIESQLSGFCVNNFYIEDGIGKGPELLKEEYY